ncbi:MAG: choline dehydrogenase [Rickettsiales bacterium]|nr:choline dehydrogenase [Rickettsiales bacterium]|tara:strand:+ start:468 stop:2024 length:1557 start_codon:yes stop_codon:yes gene_type:complete
MAGLVKTPDLFSGRIFDTIVVGGGSAGAVISARMTESTANEVLLLEAGPDYPQPEHLPGDLADGRWNSMKRHDWGYRHRPTTHQLRFPLPRGRVVGGSSAVNTCIALRGQPGDFDEWAALGLDEWSWEHCLPAFKRLETDQDFSDEWHGRDGPLPIRRHPGNELSIWQGAFLEACAELGYPSCEDSNRPGSWGAGPHAMNRINGRRISAAEAWLTAEVRARENLTILSETEALRVLWFNRQAAGVEVLHGGRLQQLRARQVVLCCGSIGTPTVLLRSGVGPVRQLERLGIDPVMDLPGVGARLLDHPGTAFFMLPRWGMSDRKAPLIQTVLRYSSETSAVGSDVQLQPGSSVPLPFLHLPLVSMMAVVGKPVGSGQIHWPSLRRGAKPVIESALLEDAADRAVAVAALGRAFELSQSKPMQQVAIPLYPGPRVLSDSTRLSQWIRKVCDSGYHPCGTVPMGPDTDPGAAVDGRGRVRGVTGLVVADASIMPTIPSSNTNLPTLMIGERFGAWLRDQAL